MTGTLSSYRTALLDFLRGPWSELWIAASDLDTGTAALMLPYLQREGAEVRVLVPVSTLEWEQLAAVRSLRSLKNCQVRRLPGLSSCFLASGPGERALLASGPLTLSAVDGARSLALLLEGAVEVHSLVRRWWEEGDALTDSQWAKLLDDLDSRTEIQAMGEEISRLGAFVRVSVKGSRRSVRLDPRDFGAPGKAWGQAVRPVEVDLYRLDELLNAKNDLEAMLAEKGIPWRGYYLVPRPFLEKEWPRLFAAREQKLKDWLESPAGKDSVQEQLAAVRHELEAYFQEIGEEADTGDFSVPEWAKVQAENVLSETVSDAILVDDALQYQAWTILPEDPQSVDELRKILRNPKLRSRQLTFGF